MRWGDCGELIISNRKMVAMLSYHGVLMCCCHGKLVGILCCHGKLVLLCCCHGKLVGNERGISCKRKLVHGYCFNLGIVFLNQGLFLDWWHFLGVGPGPGGHEGGSGRPHFLVANQVVVLQRGELYWGFFTT